MGWTEKVDLWMCRLVGLPVSESWDQPPGPSTPRQIAVVGLCVCVSAVVGVVRAFLLMQVQESNAYTTYISLAYIFFSFASVAATLHMAAGDRSAPKRLAVRSACLREAMVEHGLGVAATDACRTASALLLAATILCICYEEVTYIGGAFELFNSVVGSSVANFLESLVGMKDTLLFWTVIHRSASQPLAELGVVQDLIRELSMHETEPDLNAPVVELAPELGPGQLVAPPLTFDRCQLLIDICDQANKLRLESNMWLHVPSCLMLFNAAWVVPLFILELNAVSPGFAIAHIVISLILYLAPMFFAQLVKHKREILVQKAGRKAECTDDPDLRRRLNKLKIHAREMFPDSPCVLVNFNLSFLPVLVSVAALTLTTFFPREN